jgi:hypothetical protein
MGQLQLEGAQHLKLDMEMLSKSLLNNLGIRSLPILALLGLGFMCGCRIFIQPSIEKELLSQLISKNHVKALKDTILKEGYERKSKDDYPWQGAKCTNYSKEMVIGQVKTEVQILLSFIDTDAPKDFYRNLGLSVVNNNYPKIPEVKTEVTRMEAILYEKLLSLTGKENVRRGKEEIYNSPEGR